MIHFKNIQTFSNPTQELQRLILKGNFFILRWYLSLDKYRILTLNRKVISKAILKVYNDNCEKLYIKIKIFPNSLEQKISIIKGIGAYTKVVLSSNSFEGYKKDLRGFFDPYFGIIENKRDFVIKNISDKMNLIENENSGKNKLILIKALYTFIFDIKNFSFVQDNPLFKKAVYTKIKELYERCPQEFSEFYKASEMTLKNVNKKDKRLPVCRKLIF